MAHHPVVEFSWADWHGHPSVIIGLVILTGWYLLSVGPLRHRYQGSGETGSGQITLFLTGLTILFVALLSPLHELGDNYLFSAHMTQHLLMTLVVPPLLLVGTPPWLVRSLLRPAAVMAIARKLTRPVMAFIIFSAVFAMWHVPAFYDLALRERGIHILEHVMFLSVGLIMWWPILGRLPELPRPPYLVQILYLFVLPTITAILGAIITFADGVLYEWYAEAPRIWHISAHSDQQLGGIIMWVPGGLVFLLTLIVVFLVWAGHEESDAHPQESGFRR